MNPTQLTQGIRARKGQGLREMMLTLLFFVFFLFVSVFTIQPLQDAFVDASSDYGNLRAVMDQVPEIFAVALIGTGALLLLWNVLKHVSKD